MIYFELTLVAVIEGGRSVEVWFLTIDDDVVGNDELVEYVVRVYTKYIVNTPIETSPRGLMD